MDTWTAFQQQMFACAADPDLFRLAKARACEYMAGVREQPVYPPEAALAGLAEFDEALPEGPCEPGAMLRQLHRLGSPATTASTHLP